MVFVGKEGRFKRVAATEKNDNWESLIKRQGELYLRLDDVRTPFARDYT